jgi:hypothetical protein
MPLLHALHEGPDGGRSELGVTLDEERSADAILLFED